MRRLGKKNVIGILIDAVDYEAALDLIFRRPRSKGAARQSPRWPCMA